MVVLSPIKLEVYAASPDTEALVAAVSERWGRMDSQVSTDDLADVPVLAGRPLERDPTYQPRYRAAPTTEAVALELTGDEERIVAGLIATGVYGETEGDALRAAFMRWCNTHVTRVRRPFVSFA